MAEDKISDVITSLEEVFAGLESVHTDAELSKLLRNGNVISGRSVRKIANQLGRDDDDKTMIRMYDDSGVFVGVYEYNKSKDIYRPYKMFAV